MIRLKDTTHASTADFLRSAVRVAEYYGFNHLDDMKPARIEKRALPAKQDADIAFARRDERSLASIAKRCAAIARTSNEHLLGWRVAGGSGSIPSTVFELHVVGTQSAVAEALLLSVVHAITEEAGLKDRRLLVNNIGSHDSSNRFVRDVAAYLRKHLETISPTLRPRAAVDPLGTLVQLVERGHPAVPRAPQSMEYLTEEERRRFWELLEYLESYGIPYELSPQVLGSRDCWSHSLFEVSVPVGEADERITIAFGGRYDPLATRFAGAHTPAVTVSIHCETRGKTSVKRETRGMPSIYFAHLGPEAKRRALSVLEELRRAEIPVYHSLLFERIGEQMSLAQQYAVPYILIMGYKEAMENSILVREVATNSQDAVPLPELPNYLRRRRLGSWKTLAPSL